MKKLHLWLSIPLGLIISIICLTGAIMVFQQEILEITNKERYFIPQAEGERLDNESLIAAVNRQMVSDTVKSIEVYNDPVRAARATLASGRKNYVYVNPYTAQITGYYNAREGFFHQVMLLHRWLMLPDRAVGRSIVGISTIFMIFIMITGIARWLKHRSYRLRLNGNFFVKVFSLHRILGIYAALILILCALSGLMWSFEWYRSGVTSLLGISMREVYVIHTGAWGGMVTKWATFIASLIGASLPITGYIIYFRRKSAKRGRSRGIISKIICRVFNLV